MSRKYMFMKQHIRTHLKVTLSVWIDCVYKHMCPSYYYLCVLVHRYEDTYGSMRHNQTKLRESLYICPRTQIQKSTWFRPLNILRIPFKARLTHTCVCVCVCVVCNCVFVCERLARPHRYARGGPPPPPPPPPPPLSLSLSLSHTHTHTYGERERERERAYTGY